ncbi:MAG: glycosyltransferase family 87 protein [Xanthobacteraceae bacterium]
MKKAAVALIAAYVTFLAAAYVNGLWLRNEQGRSNQTDFVGVWAAGRLVRDGRATAAYDWPVHKAVEEEAVGHSFDKYFPWSYPPAYLFVAAILSLLPYSISLLFWVALTLPAYAMTIGRIIGRRVGFALACAFPGVLWNVWTGQNGFLTTALLGSALCAMETQPRLAGVFLGLLSYKPQFGLLFPIVLIVNRQWRIFAWAAAVTSVMIVLPRLLFGPAIWQAFFGYLPLTSQLVLGEGLGGYHELQTVFGVTRLYGGSETVAWTVQIGFAILGAIAVCLLWRRQVAFEIKAAALSVAVLLSTPYLYFYDLVVLAVPMAFLFRIGFRDGFSVWDIAAFVLAIGLVFIAPVVGFPAGLLAVLLIASAISRRVMAGRLNAP